MHDEPGGARKNKLQMILDGRLDSRRPPSKVDISERPDAIASSRLSFTDT